MLTSYAFCSLNCFNGAKSWYTKWFNEKTLEFSRMHDQNSRVVRIRGKLVDMPPGPVQFRLRMSLIALVDYKKVGRDATVLVKADDHFIKYDPQKGSSTGGVSSCLLYTSPSPRDLSTSRMPSSA